LCPFFLSELIHPYTHARARSLTRTHARKRESAKKREPKRERGAKKKRRRERRRESRKESAEVEMRSRAVVTRKGGVEKVGELKGWGEGGGWRGEESLGGKDTGRQRERDPLLREPV
jgi:hypothetical protein